MWYLRLLKTKRGHNRAPTSSGNSEKFWNFVFEELFTFRSGKISLGQGKLEN